MKGRTLSYDLRTSIVDEIIRNGGDIHTGYFPGRFSDVANHFRVSRSCVENLWRRLHKDRTIEPKRHGGGNPIRLTDGDLQLIETWKKARPTSSLREIYDGLNEFGDIPNGTSISAISRALNYSMLSGLKYSRKKNKHIRPGKIYSGKHGVYTNVY